MTSSDGALQRVVAGDSSPIQDIEAICKEKGGNFLGPWKYGEYAPRSDFIHNVLGWIILAIILAWSCIILRVSVFARCCGLRGPRRHWRQSRPSNTGSNIIDGGNTATTVNSDSMSDGNNNSGSNSDWERHVSDNGGLNAETDGKISRVLCSAFLSAGFLSCTAGFFLFSWVTYFLKPDDLGGLHNFVRQDLVSMQHLALSELLFAAGACEVYFAWALATEGIKKCRDRSWVHQVWFANMALGGCLFLAHPQKTVELAIQHSIIGTSLVFGAHFLTCEKLRNFEACLEWKFPMDPWDVPMDLAAATVAFTIAAGVLIAFHDFREDDGHRGVLIACQGSAAVVIIAFVVSSVTLLALLGVTFVTTTSSRRQRAQRDRSAKFNF